MPDRLGKKKRIGKNNFFLNLAVSLLSMFCLSPWKLNCLTLTLQKHWQLTISAFLRWIPSIAGILACLFTLDSWNTHTNPSPYREKSFCSKRRLSKKILFQKKNPYFGKHPSCPGSSLTPSLILAVRYILLYPLLPFVEGKCHQTKQHCCTHAPCSNVWYRLTVKRPSILQGEGNKSQTSCSNLNLKCRR